MNLKNIFWKAVKHFSKLQFINDVTTAICISAMKYLIRVISTSLRIFNTNLYVFDYLLYFSFS